MDLLAADQLLVPLGFIAKGWRDAAVLDSIWIGLLGLEAVMVAGCVVVKLRGALGGSAGSSSSSDYHRHQYSTPSPSSSAARMTGDQVRA